MATERPELKGAAVLIQTHLCGGDMEAALDRTDCREAARLLAMALAGVIHLRGGDPDEFMAHLIAERMRIALSTPERR